MASVTSLGLHQPAGLQSAIDQLLVPPDAPSSSYTWEITVDEAKDEGIEAVEDELLATKFAVVWSRGGVFRKTFNFELDKEPIAQALFAYFPASDNAPGRLSTSDASSSKLPVLKKALVVFLKTQAHVHFLSGTNHIVHLPFEVETVCPGPRGVVIQRKYKPPGVDHGSFRLSRAPPNTFVSSQAANASFTSAGFSVDALGKPKPLPVRLSSTLGNMWEPPLAGAGNQWPRLVTLTDPLLELGLVVARQEGNAANTPLGPGEEILHLEEVPLPWLGQEDEQLVLAVTVNRDTSKYSVWRVTYMQAEDPFVGRLKRARKSAERRRSSMPPGFLSSAATPVQPSFRESFGAPLPGKRPRKSEKLEKPLDFVSSLNPDMEKEPTTTRKTSRRASSMVARADLSVSQDRPIFSEQVPGSSVGGSRRIGSGGSFHGRASGGGRGSLTYGQTIHPSLASLLEAPLGGGLEEDYENLGRGGRDSVGLAEEMLFTNIQTVPMDNSNVRYSLSNKPATSQCKVFFLLAPRFAHDDPHRGQLLVGIQDPVEKRSQLLRYSLEKAEPVTLPKRTSTPRQRHAVVVRPIQTVRAQNVVDSCKITDNGMSGMLILSEGMQGRRELSLQAPWGQLITIPLPTLLHDSTLTLNHWGRFKDRDFHQPKIENIEITSSDLAAFRSSRRQGQVDVVDKLGRHHQLRIQLRPSCPLAREVLDACRGVISSSYAEKFIVGWWHIMQFLDEEEFRVVDKEWSSTVILMLSVFLSLGRSAPPTVEINVMHRKRRGPSGSFGSIAELEDWRTLQLHEAPNSSGCPPWMLNRGWQWALDEDMDDDSAAPDFATADGKFMTQHIRYAKQFMVSAAGQAALGESGYLPTAANRNVESRLAAAINIFTALHLLIEEYKLNAATPEQVSPGAADLRVLLGQIARWMQWRDLAAHYELGIQEGLDPRNDDALQLDQQYSIPAPELPGSILDWVQSQLAGGRNQAWLSLADVHRRVTSTPAKAASPDDSRWDSITPRSLMFIRFFERLKPPRSPARFVEAMHACGMDRQLLETLPEAVLVPLRDAISVCQPQPPPTWSKELLELVSRCDISQALEPGKHLRHPTANLLTPTHQAVWDFRMLCQTVEDYNTVGYDEGEGTERQAVIRALFREDRRLNEAQDLLSTHKTRIVRLNPQTRWTESEYLEQQKEFVTRIATGTLATPVGRGLLYYSLRFPLLTQKFHITGFNLNCTVRPTNVIVGVDKSQFTEEKVCWSFFHQGVSSGLAISPQAKGIDTSWILFNKPGQDLNNRHAGFLLALGLNGHLKGVAKWVAFKYLTTKHTMTSIGLLLGLAASYLGSMDSLITRLLSVHVTRMLPRGAAELNLSPLTQTTGIMGIGLVYCKSQHRRMSEIMLSEIVHVDEEEEEEPLRSECYRLAAGFALGFINLGQGGDLKGLRDMRMTEKLVSLATSIRKVELVHILDRATAGAVVAIALIYMKSEDRIMARKIDVPDSVLQFDYVRPDVLLLRTVAKNLIMWNEIEPTAAWIASSLPRPYRHRCTLAGVTSLKSTDLPFFNIVAGLCFSIALRFAGSASTKVRDLLVHYLDQFILIAHLPTAGRPNPDEPPPYDEMLARSCARTCQDVLSLSAAMVMAGTGDLIVLRRLRVLHGRDDPETPYGSHMAAHLAIGALFLGCGTATFGTSDLAIASMLVAFYPIFPTTVMDNRSHLQAFRHFWVLATETRCLVAKDVATDQPITIPIQVRLKKGSLTSEMCDEHDGGEDIVLARQTPCLLPPLSDISSIKTNAGPGFWDIEMDFVAKPHLVDSFQHNQSIYLRRRPAQEQPYSSTLRALGRDALADAVAEGGSTSNVPRGQDPMEWVFGLDAVRGLNYSERAAVLDRTESGTAGESASSVVDARLVLEQSVDGMSRDRLLGLKLLFDWAGHRTRTVDEDAQIGTTKEKGQERGGEKDEMERLGPWWMRDSFIESLKAKVWVSGIQESGQ